MRKNRKNQFKIIAACSVAIFSLASMIGGAYSWFTLMLKQTAETEMFQVVNLGFCDLYSVELIKFNYPSTVISGTGDDFVVVDYFAPQNGSVDTYGYDMDLKQFGYEDAQHNWQPVETMNTYDPVDLKIFGGSLRDLHCNAIYKFTISSSQYTEMNLNATAAKIIEKTKEENELFLTTCIDYDLFIVDDLADSNPLFDDGETDRAYYPDYIDKSLSMTDLQETYYKISYLSSIKSSHPNFYESSETEIPISESTPVEFVYDSTADINLLTFYVNVNYSPDQLEDQMTKIYQGDIRAVYDFGFKFFFFEEGE